jgi:hypothetical protein
MLFLHTKDHSEKHLHLLLLLAKAIFFLGYALVIAKYWKVCVQLGRSVN